MSARRPKRLHPACIHPGAERNRMDAEHLTRLGQSQPIVVRRSQLAILQTCIKFIKTMQNYYHKRRRVSKAIWLPHVAVRWAPPFKLGPAFLFLLGVEHSSAITSKPQLTPLTLAPAASLIEYRSTAVIITLARQVAASMSVTEPLALQFESAHRARLLFEIISAIIRAPFDQKNHNFLQLRLFPSLRTLSNARSHHSARPIPSPTRCDQQ